MRFLLMLVALLLANSIFPTHTYAQEPQSHSSAQLTVTHDKMPDTTWQRAQAVQKVFEKYNSPLVPYAYTYVEYADKHGVDWRLLPAISGLESSFGKHFMPGSYNAYGWGGGHIYFDSWEDGIDTINMTLRKNYMDKWGAKDVWEIGPIYAESPTWAVRVSSFMDEIDEAYTEASRSSLLATL